MIRPSFLAFLGSLFLMAAGAQTPATTAKEAFVLHRLLANRHLQPKPLDAALSKAILGEMIKKLDEDKQFFTQDDIGQMEAAAANLPEQIFTQKTGLLELTTRLYAQRVNQVDSLLKTHATKPVQWLAGEVMTAREDSSAAANAKALNTKWQRQWKLALLAGLATRYEDLEKKPVAARQKAWLDSTETVLRKRFAQRQQAYFQRLTNRPGGIAQTVAEAYLEAIAGVQDPHTTYFSKSTNQQFQEALGQKTFAFGFRLEEDEEGKPRIDELLAGSPAFKSGQLSKGDVIEAVQWGNQKPIDLKQASSDELLQVLSMSNTEQATLTLRKADGSQRQVVLSKAKTQEQDEDIRVSSYLLQGPRKLGYIALPSFYNDWENENGNNGCANDVAREVIKLKKEGMEALVLDLRFNGGGSLQEAVELAGIFVDAGPMLVAKSREPKPYTFKDVNRGTVYDGPLVVLINGYSASAAELVAAALQDWRRALIVGSPSYGKATGQVVWPLDTVLAAQMEQSPKEIEAPSYAKITGVQLFRINGGSAQFSGVVPDVVLPDRTSLRKNKERDQPFALAPGRIEPNKYYTPLPALPVAALQAKAAELMQQDSFFRKLSVAAKLPETKPDWPLQWAAYWDQYQKLKIVYMPAAEADEADVEDLLGIDSTSLTKPGLFSLKRPATPGETPANNPSDDSGLALFLQNDPYLRIIYQLAPLFIK